MTGPSIRDRLELSPEVAVALAEGQPVVALESTLISHGLPYPQNLEVAAASEAAVRAGGAVPATVAGTPPLSRTAASDARATSRLAGYGRPWLISVDSRATIGRPARRASSTSGLTRSRSRTDPRAEGAIGQA